MTGSAAPARVAGIVLAAGSSSRMPGSSKLLRPWGETTVLGAVVHAASAAGLDPIVVVTGHDPEPVARAAGSGVRVVHHPGWGDGRASSLGAGLARLAALEDVEAAVVLLGDEPEVRASAVRHVVAEWRRRGGDMARARYRDRSGHPVLLGRGAWEDALLLRGDAPAWERLLASGARGVEAEIDGCAPIDVDAPADLAAARARHRAAAPEGKP